MGCKLTPSAVYWHDSHNSSGVDTVRKTSPSQPSVYKWRERETVRARSIMLPHETLVLCSSSVCYLVPNDIVYILRSIYIMACTLSHPVSFARGLPRMVDAVEYIVIGFLSIPARRWSPTSQRHLSRHFIVYNVIRSIWYQQRNYEGTGLTGLIILVLVWGWSVKGSNRGLLFFYQGIKNIQHVVCKSCMYVLYVRT